MASRSAVSDFGTTPEGESVQRITIASPELTVSVLDRGAILQGVWLPGLAQNLTLGSEVLADYFPTMQFHGALIAPVVNRLSGGAVEIDGTLCRFEKNLDDRMTLHSGATGAQHRRWEVVTVAADRVVLRIDLPDGLGGFPGNRVVTAEYTVTGAALRLAVTATSDAPTIFNAANHSYWNLDGSANFSGHRLKVAAESWLPGDADFAPTGEIRGVEGTAMDFRRERELAPDTPPLDNTFCLSHGQVALRDVLWLTGGSGVSMTVATTEPGIQLYDARNARRPGHGAYEGLAIEAQNWPDAPSHAGFPSFARMPGEEKRQVTEWRFVRR